MNDFMDYIAAQLILISAFTTWLGSPVTPADYIYKYEVPTDLTKLKFATIWDPTRGSSQDVIARGPEAFLKDRSAKLTLIEIGTTTRPDAAAREAFVVLVDAIILGLETAAGDFPLTDITTTEVNATTQFDESKSGLQTTLQLQYLTS